MNTSLSPKKPATNLQNLQHANVWYCEEGPLKIWIGLVIREGEYHSVNVIEKTYYDAYTAISESGRVLLCQPLSEIISEFLVFPETGPFEPEI